MATKIEKGKLTQIIHQGDSVMLVKEAEEFARLIAGEGVSKSQIRTIFGEVRNIDIGWKESTEETNRHVRRLLLLKPRMAYQGKRDSKVPATKVLMDTLTDAIDLVISDNPSTLLYQRFKHFAEFFEAIVAYHTVYEKKNS